MKYQFKEEDLGKYFYVPIEGKMSWVRVLEIKGVEVRLYYILADKIIWILNSFDYIKFC
jgi:hypothetical protein